MEFFNKYDKILISKYINYKKYKIVENGSCHKT
jgi:hypothetical protein